MAATGEHVRARKHPPTEELTAHELRVARIVAAGASNREAAAALFVSPKTIEFHLGHIYRKLGLHSRTQLAARFARDLPGAP
jgi:DNA-binding CsgD family transcriptional regulator